MPEVIVTLNKANLSASVSTTNLMTDTELANVPLPAEGESGAYDVEVFVVASASGVNITVQAAQQTMINDKEIISIGTTLLDDHSIGSYELLSGQPLSIKLRETAASATTDVLLKIVASPI